MRKLALLFAAGILPAVLSDCVNDLLQDIMVGVLFD